MAAVRFSDPVEARGLVSYGNSSQPGSKHRTDQLPLFSEKKLRPFYLSREEIEANLEEKTTLEPHR